MMTTPTEPATAADRRVGELGLPGFTLRRAELFAELDRQG